MHGQGGRSEDKACVAKVFVIRVENPCNACVTLCANLERIDPVGYILFGVLRPCKRASARREKVRASRTSPRGEHTKQALLATIKGGVYSVEVWQKLLLSNSSKKGRIIFHERTERNGRSD